MKLKSFALVLVFMLVVVPTPAAQITRQHADTIVNGLNANASDVSDELNSLVNESNGQDSRLTTIESSNQTISGNKTFAGSSVFSGSATFNSTANFTGHLNAGVSADPGTPVNGDIWLNTTGNLLKARINGVTQTVATTDALGYPKDYLSGPAPVYASAATVTFKSGLKARSGDNTADIELASDVTVTLASTWTVGAPGLDAGSEASGTWYYFYLIKRVDTGVTSVIASTVNEAATGSITLPTSYTVKRQLHFCVRNNGSSDIIPFVVGEGWPLRPRIRYTATTTLVTAGPTYTAGTLNVLSAGTSSTYAAVSLSSFVPPVSRVADLHWVASGITYAKLRATSGSNDYGVAAQSSPASGEVDDFQTSTGQSIDYLIASANGFYIDCLGYTVTEVP